MRTITVSRKSYRRKGYTRKGGIRVKGCVIKSSTFKVRDRGKPGRTPRSQRWYHPKVRTGWHKGDPLAVRRRRVLRAHHGDVLASARAMDSLAKVTTDRATKRAARADAKYFFGKLKY